MTVLTPMAIGYFSGYTTDHILANLLGLSTLRHGTNPISYFSIRKNGFKPEFGGCKTGGDYGLPLEFYRTNAIYFTHVNTQNFFTPGFALWTHSFPQAYIALSTYNTMLNSFKKEPSPFIKPLIALTSIATICIFPTLKVHLPPKEVAAMEKDNIIPDYAVYTRKPVSPLNLGICGIYHHSFSSKTLDRMVENKSHVITGIFQTAVLFHFLNKNVPYKMNYIRNNKVVMAFGFILGAS